ncbi:class I SAM-dependent methyltransferase [Nocardioides aurantiacus]|uniref:class I SAM-dependent methyltransferase n=1 Tax=Nocardioides aurantiacus TaxID=86796 RepID=UPI00403EFD7A
MSREMPRRAAWVVAAAAAVVGALLSLASPEAGLAVLGLGLAALTVAAFLSFQVLIQHVVGLQGGQRPGAGPGQQRVIAAVRQGEKSLGQRITALGKQLDAQPYLNAELVRRYGDLVPTDQPMPTLGANWAATAPTILFIIDRVLGDPERETILECGSGASTVWAAAAFRKRGHGHVYSIDHDPEFAEVTRRNLRTHGLQDWATVIDAPLTQVDVPGRDPMPWYDVAGLPADLPGVDLLFVDGPPRPTGPQARYPAFPVLRHLLAPGALVVLDDTNRRDERDIAKSWQREPGMSFHQQVGRSTALRYTP